MTAANRCEVRPSDVRDIYRLAANLRPQDQAEVVALGIDPKRGIRENFRNAMLRKSYFVDGELAAMTGVCGSLLSDIGYPYLLTTKLVERVPVSFVKLAREGIADMLRHKLRLEAYVAADYTKACRFLAAIGFTIGKPEPLGSHGALFRKLTMVRG